MHAEELRAGRARPPDFPSQRTRHAYTVCSTLSSPDPVRPERVEGRFPSVLRLRSARTGRGRLWKQNRRRHPSTRPFQPPGGEISGHLLIPHSLPRTPQVYIRRRHCDGRSGRPIVS